MESLDGSLAPMPGESLGEYVQRLRKESGLTQKEVSERAGIHPQSYGKLERDQTSHLNRKTKGGLAYALGTTEEFLDAALKGTEVRGEREKSLQFCPRCWVPGTPAHSLWMHVQARFCLMCGTELRSRCVRCGGAIASLKHRFCPFCGTSYKETEMKEKGKK